MMVENARFGPVLVVGMSEAARMRQLQSDEQIVTLAVALPVLGEQRFAQTGEIRKRLLVEKKLMRIGASVMTHGDGLAAPDELRSAGAEVPPAPACQIAGPAVARAVPALHRQDGKAIA